MKKPFYLIIILSLFVNCGQRHDEVERIMEDGVEVVINHLEPYKITGEPSNIILEEVFTIDTERDEIAETGLVDFSPFEIDSDGNIYFFTLKSDENCIFKFDKKGKFLTSFGRKGQGPGEMNPGIYDLDINYKDEIIISNVIEGKISTFSTSGVLINEVSGIRRLTTLSLLKNGNYLISYLELYSPVSDISQRRKLSIFDAGLKEIKELPGVNYPRFEKLEKRNAVRDEFIPCVGNGSIFVGKRKLGYEIWVHDLEGNLIRKIRKAYSPVKVSKEYKNYFYEQRKNVLSKERLERYYFPEHFPAFQHMVADEKGRLFVLTYEENKPSGEKIYDIFNADGLFIGRVGVAGSYPPAIRIIKNMHLYCFQIKDSGYRELVV